MTDNSKKSKSILSLFLNYKKEFVLYMIVLAFLIFCEILSTITLVPIIDYFTGGNLSTNKVVLKLQFVLNHLNLNSNILFFIFLFLFFIALKNLTLVQSRFLGLKIKYQIMQDMLLDSLKSAFESKWSFFSRQKQGILLNTYTKEILGVGETVGGICNLTILLLRGLSFLAVPLFISPILSILIISFVLVLYVPSYFIGKQSRRLGELNVSTANSFMVSIQEVLAAAKSILSGGHYKQGINLVNRNFDQHKEVTIKAQILPTLNHAFFEPLTMVILFAVVWLGRNKMNISFSEIVVVLYAFRSSFPLLSQFLVDKSIISGLIPSYEQFLEIKRSANEHRQTSGSKVFNQLNSEFKLDQVSYSYNENEPILKNVNLVIPKGKVIAIVGKSGEGKSTIVDLLTGIAAPISGSVLIDNTDINQFEINSYRSKIGLVLQDNFLFNLTIDENLKWVKENLSESEIISALKLAHVDEFLAKLELGRNTNVGDRGGKLSGGQRQRIALAQAILKKPELLILDEATSALDSISEKMIHDSIQTLANKMTILIIAHRLSMVQFADYIYVLESGHFIEEGTFKDLMNKRGVFYSMAKNQGLDHQSFN